MLWKYAKLEEPACLACDFLHLSFHFLSLSLSLVLYPDLVLLNTATPPPDVSEPRIMCLAASLLSPGEQHECGNDSDGTHSQTLPTGWAPMLTLASPGGSSVAVRQVRHAMQSSSPIFCSVSCGQKNFPRIPKYSAVCGH